MKKIAILYPAHYEQSSGGAEIQILYLINACKQQNWEIHYIFEDKGTDIKNKENIVLHPLCKMKNYKFCVELISVMSRGKPSINTNGA